jgi:hypothetical protein
MHRSKWTRFDILKHIEENYPEIYFKLMGLNRFDSLQIGKFSHNLYGRLYASKVYHKAEGVTKIVFKTEFRAPEDVKKTKYIVNKANKAFMNEWIKKDLKKLSV